VNKQSQTWRPWGIWGTVSRVSYKQTQSGGTPVAACRLGPALAGCTNRPNSAGARRGSPYKRTQFAPAGWAGGAVAGAYCAKQTQFVARGPPKAPAAGGILLYKQTQLLPERCERQVLCGKRVATNRARNRTRKNKPNCGMDCTGRDWEGRRCQRWSRVVQTNPICPAATRGGADGRGHRRRGRLHKQTQFRLAWRERGSGWREDAKQTQSATWGAGTSRTHRAKQRQFPPGRCRAIACPELAEGTLPSIKSRAGPTKSRGQSCETKPITGYAGGPLPQEAAEDCGVCP
jgi:hypothetical protein